jgi:hypothetical protein
MSVATHHPALQKKGISSHQPCTGCDNKPVAIISIIAIFVITFVVIIAIALFSFNIFSKHQRVIDDLKATMKTFEDGITVAEKIFVDLHTSIDDIENVFLKAAQIMKSTKNIGDAVADI